MRKILGFFMSFMILFSFFYLDKIEVKAASEHQFSLKAYDWDPFYNDWEGTGTNDEYPNNADIDPGRIFKLDIYYVPSDTPVVGFNVSVKYDSDLVQVIDSDGNPVVDATDAGTAYIEVDDASIYAGGIWPPKGNNPKDKKVSSWEFQNSYVPSKSEIKLIAKDSTASKALENEGVIASFYFKVKDSASAGSVINFEYDDSSKTEMAMTDGSAFTTSGLTLNVFGKMSASTTLNSLAVTNGSTNYTLSPTFVPDSGTIKEYSTVVPNQITNVNISATPTDSSGTVASGTGTANLKVGNNDINMIVQAQDGTQDNYLLHVYRLNNDSSLASLSLSNDVNIGTFKKNVTSYTAIVPYKTSSTIVSASAYDSNATIVSGTGTWNLSNYGDTINTKNVVVNAENCNSAYTNVPGNACSSTSYKIDVTRTAPSSNANLSDIKVNNKTISNFSSGLYSYNLGNVSNETTDIDINATVEDTGKATITSTLGTKKLSVGDNSIDIVVKAEDGSIKTYTLKVRRLSNNSNLSSLTVTSNPIGTLSPSFTKTFYNYYTYTAPSTVTDVTVNAVVDDTGNATIISGTGTYNINNTREVNIVVQAEDGTQSSYVLKLVRSKSSNNNLKSLSIDGYNLNEQFDPSKTLYTANVSGDVTKVNISAEVEDEGNATIVSGLGEKNLVVGTNTVQVRVKAENGTTKDYTITIIRAKKTIALLSDLKVNGTTIDEFDELKKEYTLSKVPFETTSISIDATLKDPDSTVTGLGTVNLKTGSNKLYVTVTAQDGVTQTSYIINVEREKDSNSYLKDLQINGKTIEKFEKTNLSYGVVVPNDVTSLNLTAIPESSSASAVITDNNNFLTTQQNTILITVTAEDGSISIYKIHVTREKSDNNYLKNITLSSGLLNPVFDKNVNDYTVDVDRSVTKITISATVEDPVSQYTVSGPDSLAIGANTFTITVTSEKGKDNIYTIIVNRNPSNNNYLSNILVDGSTITGFNKIKQSYTIDVPSDKQNITLGASTEEIHATTKGLGTFNLETGVNTFDIVATAENGDERTYSIIVNKLKSNNSDLSSLSITQTNINPTFNPKVLNYTASVAYSVTNIDIVAVASDTKSTISGDGNKELQTGDNNFDIVVTSEDNTTTTYRIVVTRAKNNNANLSNIILSGGFSLDKVFDPNDTSYSVSVPYETSSISITAFKQDPNAVSVTGAGTVNLNTGNNVIEIIVTAEDGTTTKKYTLNIERAKSSDSTLKELTVNGGTLSPKLSSNVTKYEVTVPYEISTFDVTAIANSKDATVVIDDNKNLDVGTNVKTITVTAENGTLKVYEITVLRQPSTNNFLSALSVKDNNQKEYITAFNKTTLTYDINVENEIDSVNISGITDDSTSTIKGDGQKSIEIGNNKFEIVVKSASGIERTYVINIFRRANSNNFLSNLSIDNQTLSPEFKKDIMSYTVNVDSFTASININATPEVSTSSVVGTGEYNLVTGVNTFNVDVTAEDNTVRTYVIVVNKAASSNNYLSSLTVNPGNISPSFDKGIQEYTLNVDNSTKTLVIDAIAEDSAATVTGTGIKSLNVGSQVFEINVTAEDNSLRVYKVTVIRDASSVKDLKTLTVNGKQVDGFDKDTINYVMHVDNNVDKVNIGAEVVDSTASVSGMGERNLSTGNNEIIVTVTAEDGSVKTYTINIERAKSSNNYLSNISIDEGVYTPEFDKENLSYNITVPYEVTSLNLKADKEDQAATVEIDSNSNFIVGTNKVFINVIAENSDVRTYVINVTRQPQANNFLTDINVVGDDGIVYKLKPEFNKATYLYEVEVPGTLTSATINVTKQSTSLSVTGDGLVNITNFPQTQNIVVSTTGGLERTYTIKFVKGLSSNNKLKAITTDKGELEPKFNSDEYAYNIDLPEGTTEISIGTVKSESTQVVTGDGKISLSPGRNTVKITVTAGNGDVRTYTVFVNVGTSSKENGLSSITVDKGTLSPSFDPDTKLYTVDLNDNEEDITISATGKNSITGTGKHTLNKGSNAFEIISTDKNGNENVYRVVVNRGSVISPNLVYLAIDNYKMNETFDSNKLSYTANIYNDINTVDIIAIAEDKNATVSITGNTNMSFGNNKVTIVVTDENTNSKTYEINITVGNNKITSNIHKIENSYITTITDNKKSIDVKNEMTNPVEYLKIYNLDNTEISDNDIVGTGYIIKLEINGVVYDSKTLIIKGDINGDGDVGVPDIIKLRLHILETTTLNDTESKAADVNNDNDVGVSDLIMIRSHILGNSNLFSKVGE